MLILTGVVGLFLAGAAFAEMSGILGGTAADGADDDANPDGRDATQPPPTPPADKAYLAAILTDPDAASLPPDAVQEGTAQNDILAGAQGNDLIAGHDGDDQIGGRAGDDTLYGGAGRDDLDGAEGDDALFGGAGNDQLYGGTGADKLDGGDGDDLLFGQDGHDTLAGGNGNDTLWGGPGQDLLIAGAGNNALHGGLDNDTLLAGSGADTLFGGTGDDLLLARDQDATDARAQSYLNAGQGDDTLVAGSSDLLTGGDGADMFITGHWITDPAVVMDFNRTEDRLIIVHDDTTTTPPVVELRSPHDSDLTQIYLDGAHLASVAGSAGLTLSDIEIIAESQFTHRIT